MYFIVIDNGSEACSNVVFQTLMRFLVGMDFYVDNQIESLSILVVHKTSGTMSFSCIIFYIFAIDILYNALSLHAQLHVLLLSWW